MKTLLKQSAILLSGLPVIGLWLMTFSSNAQTGGAIYQTGPTMMRTKTYPISSVLSNNKVISFGGRENGFISSSYSDMYDPIANSFTEAPMNYIHDMGAVAKLSDGRYFIVGGGYNSGIPAIASAEIYNPGTNTFEMKAPMIASRMMVAATQLSSGKVLVAGAWYDNTAAGYAELYDIATDSYINAGSLNQPRAQAIILPANDGGAIIAGGWPSYGGSVFTSTEHYQPSSNSFDSFVSEVIPTDPGWLLSAIYTKPIDDIRMSNGNYLLLAYRSVPTIEYALIMYDPATTLFTKLNTSSPLIDTYTDGGFFDVILNRGENKAYLLGVKAGTDPQQISLITVNLSTGQVFHTFSTYTLPPSEYLNAAMTYLPSNGKILVQGIASYPDNFSATDKTYLLTPQIEVGIAEAGKNSLQSVRLFPNPVQENITIEMSIGAPGDFTVKLSDVTGRSILNDKRLEKNPGTVSWKYNLSAVPEGIYMLTIESNSGTITKKIVINK